MNPDATNLLPEDRARLLLRNYWLRFAALATLFAALLAIVNAALLIPSYRMARGQIAAKENELAALEAANAAPGVSFAAELADFTAKAQTLSMLSVAAPDMPKLSEVLSVAHPGVALTSFVFAPLKPGAAASVVVSGVAATRDALRSYDLALSAAPFAASVDLPVSSYAAEANVPFTLTLTFVSP